MTGGQVPAPQSWHSQAVTGTETNCQALAVLMLMSNPYWLSVPPPPTKDPIQLNGATATLGLLRLNRKVTGATVDWT